MHLAHYLDLLRTAEQALADAIRAAAAAHADEPGLHDVARTTAGWCDAPVERLAPFVERYATSDDASGAPEDLHVALYEGPRTGGLGYLRDLHDLLLQATACDTTWTMIGQAATGLRDQELLAAVGACEAETERIVAWLRTLMTTAATQPPFVA
jgi:hypothetical protein